MLNSHDPVWNICIKWVNCCYWHLCDTTTIEGVTPPPLQCLTEHSEAFQIHQISVTFFIFGISVIPTLPYCSPLKVLFDFFFPPAFCSHPGVPTGVSTCRLCALCSTSLGCVLICARRYATVRMDASAHHESILRMCWISVFTFLVLSSLCDCLSLLMFEVGCQAVLHPRAHVWGGGGVWGGERWGVWVNPCRIAGCVWVGVCWALFKKKTTHTLFAVACTRACILHAFAGVCGVENPLTDIHTTPGSSMFIILPKRTIKISSVRRNL